MIWPCPHLSHTFVVELYILLSGHYTQWSPTATGVADGHITHALLSAEK